MKTTTRITSQGYLSVATMSVHLLMSLLFLIVSACELQRSPEIDSTVISDADWSPENVLIIRDSLGVAHIQGHTDEDAAFGFAFAQAEDNFWQIEENFIRAIGRASEVHGSESLMDDWINRALEIPRLSVEEYDASPPKLQRILDGFAAGLNYYTETAAGSAPGSAPRLIKNFESWYPLALIRYLYYQKGFVRRSGLARSDVRDAFARSQDPDDLTALTAGTDLDLVARSPSPELSGNFPAAEQGSNSWAISPVKSASGAAMLFINPHLQYFGESQVYEGHISSEDGWNFSGYTRFGFPFPYVGFNEHLGWASTDNAADLADVFALDIDPENSEAYRFGQTSESFVEWTDSIVVATGDGLQTSVFHFRRSRHGPIVGHRNGRELAIRMARFEEPGWLDQWYEMTRATSLDEFRTATSRLDMLFGNYLYADREGSILYVYNGAVPVRSNKFNWNGVVDGSDPESEWQGYHSIEELPQVLDPASGWLQNCNQTPFLTTSTNNPDPRDYPDYMVQEGDNARSRNARRILSSQDQFSFDQWTELSLDSFMMQARDKIPILIASFDALSSNHPFRAGKIAAAIDLFRDWDYRSSLKSVETSLFVLSHEYGYGSLQSLSNALASLESDWGTWRVPWGDINRLQRPSDSDASFRDSDYSVPSRGIPSWAGASYTVWSTRVARQRARYGTGGNSYVSVVEFGERVRARSLHVFGASSVPESAHYFDQAALMPESRYKEALLYRDDVLNNASRSYHPGN